MKRIFFSFLVVLISVLIGYHIFSIWKGVSLSQTVPSKKSLLRTIKLNPSNPDPFYRLGLFYQWDIRNIDLKESLHYLREAIERNPLEQEYWLNLARIFQRMGKSNALESSLKNAILVFPTGYQGRWVSGNLFLQQGAIEKALPHFSYILTHYPNQSHLVYDVLRKVIDDTNLIIEKVIPKEPSLFKQYLSYLYERGDKDLARRVWGNKASFGYKPEREETLRHVEFLIAHNELSEAFKLWKSRLQEEGLSVSYDRDLITNGGFEVGKIWGGGFDWKINSVPGAKVSFDPSIAFEGKSSLKIEFNGKENVDFCHVY